MKWWLPMRVLTPLAFLFAAAVAAGIFERALSRGLTKLLVENLVADLREEAFRTANEIEEQLEEDHGSSIRRIVQLWATKSGVLAAVLIAPNGKLMAATRQGWLHGERDPLLDELSAFAAPVLREGVHAHPHVAQKGAHLIAAAVPVRFPAAQLGPKPRGVFAVLRDFGDDETRAMLAVRRSLVDFLFWMVLLAVLGWVGVHFGVERRIRRIIHAARAVAQGRFGAQSGVRGHDEIGELGEAFDEMSRELARLQRRLVEAREALEHMAEAVMITDAQGTIVYVNPAFARMTGYEAQEAIGQTPRILKSGKMPAEFYARMWEQIRTGQVWEGRIVNRRKDGTLYTALETIAPVKNEAGEIVRFVAVQQDVTDLERLQQRLAEVQKNEALATLVGGIAHDFNNILAGITGNLYLLARRLADAHEQEILARVQGLAERGAELVRQMMTFARQDSVRMRRFDLVPFFKEAMRSLKSILPERVRLHWETESTSLPIVGEPNQIKQVLAALLSNARDALEHTPRPQVRVRLARFAPDEDFRRRYPDREAKAWALIEVVDNGCGMDEHTRKRAFDPFFTTKEVGKGTGLGLAMVLGAMQRHGGLVELHSTPGKGTRVRLFLPLADEAPSGIEAGAKETEAAPEGQGEWVLVAEDEPALREVLAEILREHGYQVHACESGSAAAAAFARDPKRWAAAVLDVVMPEGTGPEAAAIMRRERENLPIIFLTGHDRGALPQGFAEDARTRLLFKPVRAQELLRTLAEIIAR